MTIVSWTWTKKLLIYWIIWQKARYVHSLIVAHIAPGYVHHILGICDQIDWHTYIWHKLGNNTWSKSCSWLYFGIYVQKCWVCITHIACSTCELYLECGSHICSLIYILNMHTVFFAEWLVPMTSYVVYIWQLH